MSIVRVFQADLRPEEKDRLESIKPEEKTNREFLLEAIDAYDGDTAPAPSDLTEIACNKVTSGAKIRLGDKSLEGQHLQILDHPDGLLLTPTED